MKIAGISNFNFSSLANIKNAKVVKIPERPKHTNNVVGGAYDGALSAAAAERMKEGRKNVVKFQNEIQNAKKAEWQSYTITMPTGETSQLKFLKSLDVHVIPMLDVKV